MQDDAPTFETPPAKSKVWLRRTRITTSLVFALLTLALVVLWVRSCTWSDIINRQGANQVPVRVSSTRGAITIYWQSMSPNSAPVTRWWYRLTPNEPGPLYLSYHFRKFSHFRWMIIPYWMLVCIPFVALLVVVPKSALLTARFSLRTMLIATTLIAVVLGLMVWASK